MEMRQHDADADDDRDGTQQEQADALALFDFFVVHVVGVATVHFECLLKI